MQHFAKGFQIHGKTLSNTNHPFSVPLIQPFKNTPKSSPKAVEKVPEIE